MSADSQVWIGGIFGLDGRLRKDYSRRGTKRIWGGAKGAAGSFWTAECLKN
jgi:hypothetical protein